MLKQACKDGSQVFLVIFEFSSAQPSPGIEWLLFLFILLCSLAIHFLVNYSQQPTQNLLFKSTQNS